jgi:hypothetical protein
MISKIKSDLICLQETNLEVINSMIIRNALGQEFDDNFFFSLPVALGGGGGLVPARPSLLQLHSLVTTDYSFSVKVIDTRLNLDWMITGYMGPKSPMSNHL